MKSLTVANSLRKRSYWNYLLKHYFLDLIWGFFGKKPEKFWTIEKLETMIKEDFFEKKRYRFLKSFPTKMGRRNIYRWLPDVLFTFDSKFSVFKQVSLIAPIRTCTLTIRMMLLKKVNPFEIWIHTTMLTHCIKHFSWLLQPIGCL